MQVTPFCLFMLVCSCTLISAAPINNAPAETHESKQQKAHVIANRLLKELAGEHVESPSIVQAPINAENNKDAAAPADRPATEKVEMHVESPAAEDSYDEDNQDLELTPTIDDLFELYNDKYNQLYEDDEAPIDDDEIDGDDDDDDDDLFAITRQELLRYLADEEDTNEQSVPISHAPVMDDTIMTAEEHHQQRRRRSA